MLSPQKDQGLRISRILHAGYVFECEGTQIAFDPLFENPFSQNCYAFPDVRFDHESIKTLSWDAVFISHFHDDHCSLESLQLLDRKTPIYMYCVFEEIFSLIKELGFLHVHSLELGRSVQIHSFEITPHRALDVDIDSIFQIKAAGVQILNVVDSWIDPSMLLQLAQKGPWEMILWPFQTMREMEVLSPSRASPAAYELPPEWIEQLQVLKPKYIVPSSCQFIQESWSWYNQAFFPVSYRQFQQEIEAALPHSSVVRLNPSVSVILDKQTLRTASSLAWIQAFGEQNVDYKYDRTLKPPSTADISRRFAALTPTQTETVYDYCRSRLVEKYNSMQSPADDYFLKARIWRLSLYDHEGAVRHFHYHLKEGRIELGGDVESENLISWRTEISACKLLAALEDGESLTSLYVRINDGAFEPCIEQEIQSVDILEDPLIRCLFDGSVGAYQRAQLKRLQKTNLCD